MAISGRPWRALMPASWQAYGVDAPAELATARVACSTDWSDSSDVHIQSELLLLLKHSS